MRLLLNTALGKSGKGGRLEDVTGELAEWLGESLLKQDTICEDFICPDSFKPTGSRSKFNLLLEMRVLVASMAGSLT